MVRQKARKTVEELYTVGPPPPPLTTTRFDEQYFQNSKNTRCNKVAATEKIDKKKTKSPATMGAEKKDEKTFMNEEKLFGKSTKAKLFAMPNLDNKNEINFVDDNEKDEDTEEFFELIKETVEDAVGKTLSDILNRNLREVSAKIDNLGEQLRSNEVKMEKMQADLNSKIVHYGEENSRHFRYLCMKSEYDKMFYQHQNIMTTMPMENRPNIVHPYPQQFAAAGQPVPPTQIPVVNVQPPQNRDCLQQNCVSQCNFQKQSSGDFEDVKRSKSTASTKSSDMGIKDVKDLLEQLQKFYETQQAEEGARKEGRKADLSLHIQDDSADGEEDDDSSDAISSTSIEEKLGAGGDS